jgi:hypothetical protein
LVTEKGCSGLRSTQAHKVKQAYESLFSFSLFSFSFSQGKSGELNSKPLGTFIFIFTLFSGFELDFHKVFCCFLCFHYGRYVCLWNLGETYPIQPIRDIDLQHHEKYLG